jgi:deoxyribonuclease-4
VAIHAPYLVNLAGSDHSFYEKSIEVLAHELLAAPGFGARFVNVHTGSHRGAGIETGIERIAEGCAMVLSATEAGPDALQLVLENSAGGGAAVGVTVEELAAIADACDRRGIPRGRLGFCLDTAHLWGAGVRVSEPDEIDALLDAFDAQIGLDRLAMMHLNDSKSELGSRLDRHEHIGAGRIGPRGMAHFLTHASLRHVPTYLETPGMDDGYDEVNIRRALDLAAGRPLPSLPPEAMNLPPRRSKRRPAPEPA